MPFPLRLIAAQFPRSHISLPTVALLCLPHFFLVVHIVLGPEGGYGGHAFEHEILLATLRFCSALLGAPGGTVGVLSGPAREPAGAPYGAFAQEQSCWKHAAP